ncbi:hypothetical protein BDQ17DRAFT_1427297 [Cyathus striatus]|nr:hypothetical protein BDQ17DRAFT_1427297 [Cyathus striatus]
MACVRSIAIPLLAPRTAPAKDAPAVHALAPPVDVPILGESLLVRTFNSDNNIVVSMPVNEANCGSNSCSCGAGFVSLSVSEGFGAN